MESKNNKENQFMENVTLFLIFVVGLILIYSQYQFIKIAGGNVWSYLSLGLIFALVAAIVVLAVNLGGTKKESNDIFVKEKSKPWSNLEIASVAMVLAIGLFVVLNQVQITKASEMLGVKTFASGLSFKSSSSKTHLALTGDPSKDAVSVIISRGAPFYGPEIGVTFDDPVAGLEKIAQMDPSYGKNKIQLTAEEKARYIKIDTIPGVGCEYCCGADTSVDKSGRPTCGCKHSWAMRGLTAYLVKNHPELTDDEIVRELIRWKGLFFPKQMVAKYIKQSQTGQYSTDIASLLLDVDESKMKAATTAVASNNDASAAQTQASIEDLPNMVGGC